MAQDSFETLVLVAAVGFVGWYVYENYFSTTATSTTTPTTPVTSGGVMTTGCQSPNTMVGGECVPPFGMPSPTLVCPTGYSVSGTNCVQQTGAGMSCTSSAGCASGICSNGVCASAAMAGLGKIVINSMGAYYGG